MLPSMFSAINRLMIGVVLFASMFCSALGLMVSVYAGDVCVGASAGLMVWSGYWFLVVGSMHDDGGP